MIPKASTRASGQEIATHLLNAVDNEEVRLVELRGALARDPHGAFAEWEFQARALTRCTKPFFSLAISPDPKQEALSEAQMHDFVARSEERLGLSDQPRAIIEHVKNGRMHWHVVWSRIDAEEGKAVPMSFYKTKLMALTREFARDHGIELAGGYTDKDKAGPQQTLADKVYEDETGITLEQRREAVTDAWRGSDSPRAFVAALEDKGYVLCRGDKRPYVLVDAYGGQFALSRLVEGARIKDIRSYLGGEFPEEKLPTVEEGLKAVARLRDRQKTAQEAEQAKDARSELKARQERERAEMKAAARALAREQAQERRQLAAVQREVRDRQKDQFFSQMRARQAERSRKEPQGLSGWLGKVSGVNALRRQLHRYQDRHSLEAFQNQRQELKVKQHQARKVLQAQHSAARHELTRKTAIMRKNHTRQSRSIERELAREQRVASRQRQDRLPPVSYQRVRDVSGKGRLTAAMNAVSGHRTSLRNRGDLGRAFARASGAERERGEDEREKRLEREREERRRRNRERRRRDRGPERDR